MQTISSRPSASETFSTACARSAQEGRSIVRFSIESTISGVLDGEALMRFADAD